MLKAFKGLFNSERETSDGDDDEDDPQPPQSRFAAAARTDSRRASHERVQAKRGSGGGGTQQPPGAAADGDAVLQPPTLRIADPIAITASDSAKSGVSTPGQGGGAGAYTPPAVCASPIGSASHKARLAGRDDSFSANYRLLKLIAKGSSGKCYTCEPIHHPEFSGAPPRYCAKVMKRAAKLLSPAKRSDLDEAFRNECDTLRRLRHPSIVKLIDLDDQSDPERIFIVMELMEGGELFDFLCDRGALSELEAAAIASQVAGAVAHCHGQGVVHRDLKPENLLLQHAVLEPGAAAGAFRDIGDGAAPPPPPPGGGGAAPFVPPPIEVKVADFGFAKTILESNTHSVLGTPGYVAPEILLGDSEGHGKPVDIWSFGIIIYVLMFGYMPFEELESGPGSRPTRASLLENYHFRFDGPDEKQWTGVSTSAKDLLWRMLRIDPVDRITAQEVCDHPWVRLGAAHHRAARAAHGSTPSSSPVGSPMRGRVPGSPAARAAKAADELAAVVGSLASELPSVAVARQRMGRHHRSKRNSIAVTPAPERGGSGGGGGGGGGGGAAAAPRSGKAAAAAKLLVEVAEGALTSGSVAGGSSAQRPRTNSITLDEKGSRGGDATAAAADAAMAAAGSQPKRPARRELQELEHTAVVGRVRCRFGAHSKCGFDPEHLNAANSDAVRVASVERKGRKRASRGGGGGENPRADAALVVVADGHGHNGAACARASAALLRHALPARRRLVGADDGSANATAASAHAAAFSDASDALTAAPSLEVDWSGACAITALLLQEEEGAAEAEVGDYKVTAATTSSGVRVLGSSGAAPPPKTRKGGGATILEVSSVGNCRAVLGRREGDGLVAVALSADQTPRRGDERRRVRTCGARVLTMAQLEQQGAEGSQTEPNSPLPPAATAGRGGTASVSGGNLLGCLELLDGGSGAAAADASGLQIDETGDSPRVWAPLSDTLGAVFTRALGDDRSRGLGIVPTPEVTRVRLDPPGGGAEEEGGEEELWSPVPRSETKGGGRDELVVLGSDGLFAFLTSQQVVDIAGSCDTPGEACRRVVAAAYASWLQYEVRTDHISAVVIFLDAADEVEEGDDEAEEEEEEEEDTQGGGGSALSQSILLPPVNEPPLAPEAAPAPSDAATVAWLTSLLVYVPIFAQGPAGFAAAAPTAPAELRRRCALAAAAMKRVAVQPGEAVIQQGDAADNFYVVEDGTFDVTVAADGGGEAMRVHTYSAGDYFGELALLHNEPRRASVTCVGGGGEAWEEREATVWALGREDFCMACAGVASGDGAGSAAAAAVAGAPQRRGSAGAQRRRSQGGADMHAAVAPVLSSLNSTGGPAASFVEMLGGATEGGAAALAATLAACPLRVTVRAAGGERIEGDGQSTLAFPLRVEYRGASWELAPQASTQIGLVVPTIDRALHRAEKKAAPPDAARAELCARQFCGDGVLAQLLKDLNGITGTPKLATDAAGRQNAAAARLQGFVDELVSRACAIGSADVWRHIEAFFECGEHTS